MENNVVLVKIWGREVGYVVWDRKRKAALFEYAPSFIQSGPDIAPTIMSIHSERSLKGLPWIGDRDNLYQGLPPMLADSLPDKWGDSVFRLWLNRMGIPASKVSSVDRLSYIGSRGMGALEYEPARNLGKESFGVDVSRLYNFAQDVLSERRGTSFNGESLLWQDMVKIGTSAGGKRPKALVAINEATGEVRSGQTDIPAGFKHYILKFGETSSGYPSERIEYVYSQMAHDAGITMMPCTLKQYDGVTHFLTERFDRDGNRKIHLQTVAAMKSGCTDYDDIFSLLRTLNLPYPQQEQLYRTMVFNVLSRNVDDHTKNFSLLMRENGAWELAPAYDLTFTVDLSSPGYVNRQSLTVNGKDEEIGMQDLLDVAARNEIDNPGHIISRVRESLSLFPELAKESGISSRYIDAIQKQIGL